MDITRRDALLGATAAAVVTGLTVAPLAIKAAGVKVALAGDPVLPAYETFEAARLEYIAISDHVYAVAEAVEAEMPPEPHRNRTCLELSPAEADEARKWRRECHRHITARLGMDEDGLRDIYQDRMELAYAAVADIQATTIAGLLCQVRAWWNVREVVRDPEVPKPGPEENPWEPEVIVRRLYHDVARLAGGMWS